MTGIRITKSAALSRRRQRLLRRLPRAQQSLARRRARRDARHHRPQRRRQDHHDGHHHRQDAARRGRRAISTGASTSPSSTRPRSPISASAASSRSRPCSRATPSRTISVLALQGRPRRLRGAVRRAQPRASATRIDSILEPSASAHRDRHRRRSLPRPEAVAGDRHAAGAGPQAAARRRARRPA